MSPTFLPGTGINAHGGRLAVDHADRNSSAMMAAIVSAGVSPGNGDHVETDGADGGHRLELGERQSARGRRLDHRRVLGHGDERAREAADELDAIAPPFLTASLSSASAAVVPGAPMRSTPIASRTRATLSPSAGVGASERSTMPNGTPSSPSLAADQLAHARDLERGALDDPRERAEIRVRLAPRRALATTPGPLTPTLSTQSGSPMPWNAPAMNGLSSTALQNTTSLAQPMPSRSAVRSAVSSMISAHARDRVHVDAGARRGRR